MMSVGELIVTFLLLAPPIAGFVLVWVSMEKDSERPHMHDKVV